ncbi:uncharacterized protein si:dkey-28a3.2 [Syngnathoides biaculeatus]|uniref:uncharacterized protein si:dkey-28a3.2 n=1 Tax=Syngnathoides biaculeatus TaxID=300417 RepID=UPI002ADD6009|nr:uncharacterized protein si:dkey-28a3.2 [Syngnathoides biaculeatus]XP_061665009.1 uncharacterized protein si:dkey-28a3.2 [Syngnathoides biaculeatus]XP_061665010.1 uncharacterized protein si:dkey-28a3.2 [Syngnathoides biaculeatus]XP_061665011.1 uncharacterized protein si:dkey-28a3.2 [Syngnathoides biaculeatus]
MPTVKSVPAAAFELDDATPALSAKATRTVGTMTNSGRTRVFTPIRAEPASPTGNAHAPESDEEQVARRREQWRLKKRAQRAKMAARLGKTREKAAPVITASAHFLLRDADRRGGRTQRQTSHKSAQMQRKSARLPQDFVPPSNLPRCRAPWGRILEAQRHLKVKALSTPSAFNIRRIPPMDIKDTPEQILAKQREYWRVKKREQRAKMSMEAKARLKEKDCLMRRVRRYQNILEEMRRARAFAVDPETIGGFVKEDRMVFAGPPRTGPFIGSTGKHGLGGSGNKVHQRASARSTKTNPVQPFSHLTLVRPQSPRKSGFPNPTARPGQASCVMKMLVSDQALPKEDRVAKKREYWRVMKRQQRAARAARLKQGVAEARPALPDQRSKDPRPASAHQAPLLNHNSPTNAIKQEPDLNPVPEQPICPDLKPLALKPEPDPSPAADCQVTTLLAVASMKKLLEESLSTVTDCKGQEPDIGMKVKEEPGGTEAAPVARAPDRQATPCRRPAAATCLQKKREYWKLMKRQQRARLKERRGEGGGGGAAGRLHPRGGQTPTLAARSINAAKAPPKLLPKPSLSPGGSIPAIRGPLGLHESADLDPALPALKPPDNPLSSINLHPILPPARPVRAAPSKQFWSSRPPLNATGPPGCCAGDDDDSLKRKREYWRIKKKEQRARKAVGEKGIAPRRGSRVLPVPDLHAKDLCQRATCNPLSEASESLISNSADARPHCHYGGAVDDEEGPVSDATWRNLYLMDYDPVNQLLVCVACGELQHSHSPEGAAAHIDEAHPHTRALEPAERRRILDAWDEQVSRRERFFARQLQQRGGTGRNV